MRTEREIIKKYIELDKNQTNFTYDEFQITAVKKALRWVLKKKHTEITKSMPISGSPL